MVQSELESISTELERRITEKSLVLPMLPQVTSQVLSLVNDVDSDAAALTKLIQSDQALAGHVMRIANSAAYSPSVQMTSLQQAIARLGMQNIADIAMIATMGPELFIAKGFENLIADIWRNSLATAVWAREIARLGRRNVESTFLCGLLFQIGKPVVLQTCLEISTKRNEAFDLESINTLIEHYHRQVGIIVADFWRLPQAVSHTIAGMDGDQTREESRDIVETVKAARLFAAIAIGDKNYSCEALCVTPEVIDINLYPDDVNQLIEKADAIHDTIAALSV